jgi:2-succinyl-5-enolpyruvyl-6-hydroxy-3-cyclohexene-1-carboxylate synthase
VRDPSPRRTDLILAGIGDVNATWCATLVDEWVRAGVSDAVVCPGSRSTPMALALAADDRIRVHVHHDERSGAFVALGLGRATGRPAVVLTTSGTGAVELHPAVVEADLGRVPLLAVTADRPPELRDVGAPQTIDQTHLFGRSVRWFAEPGPPDVVSVGSWRSIGARAVIEAMASPPGPVHLNLAFREPLVGAALPLPDGRPGGAPWHESLAIRATLAPVSRHAIADRLRGRTGVVLAGAGIDDPEGVLLLAEILGWPVLADPRSGCRVPHRCVVAHAEAVLGIEGPHRDPEVILRLGAAPVAKAVNRWSAAIGADHVLVERDGTWLDPDRTAALVVAADPGRVCREVAAELEHEAVEPVVAGAVIAAPSRWLERWQVADDAAVVAVHERLSELDHPSEPGTARAVSAAVPDGGSLMVSSSMPIRDVESFAAPRPDLSVHANRGANGIDGVLSTAVGIALGGSPTALLIGDVALLHDTNGLLGLAARPVDLCIVVVHNDGGGIFSFLPQAGVLDAERFEALFGTPHGVDLTALAIAHGLPVMEAMDDDAVGTAVAAALSAGGAHVVVVRTDRAENVAVHRQLGAAAAEAARAALAALAPGS